jgi:hypothetical protein
MPVLECSRCNELFYSASGTGMAPCERCGGGVWRVFEDEASFERVMRLPRTSRAGDHAGLVYSDAEEAGDFCVGYAREGLALGEAVLAVLPGSMRGVVQARLGPREREQIRFEASERVYADFHPERLIDWYVGVIESTEGPVRVLAGPDAESAARIAPDDWRRFEYLVHERVLELEVTALCVYDGPALPGEFIPIGTRTHPLVVTRAGELRRNGEFRYRAQAA